jgi:hypothetical protein
LDIPAKGGFTIENPAGFWASWLILWISWSSHWVKFLESENNRGTETETGSRMMAGGGGAKARLVESEGGM